LKKSRFNRGCPGCDPAMAGARGFTLVAVLASE
jgi:hypothetical protein